ncbi:interleukin-8-like [Pleurodeles waltl]|uniref:interleukin-8-like n=1 Tax=Pleurodeles waltl TaxID=8319 RepID=UPI0037097583
MNYSTSFTLLQLLVICAVLSVGITASLELRCQCIRKVTDFIPIAQISKVELIPPGAHCSTVEIIAKLKQGMQTCLDPEAEWVKRIIDRMMNRYQFVVVVIVKPVEHILI